MKRSHRKTAAQRWGLNLFTARLGEVRNPFRIEQQRTGRDCQVLRWVEFCAMDRERESVASPANFMQAGIRVGEWSRADAACGFEDWWLGRHSDPELKWLSPNANVRAFFTKTKKIT